MSDYIDYPQVIKNVYDRTNKTLKTVDKLVLSVTGVTEADNATDVIPAVDSSNLRKIQVYATRNSGTAGDIKIYASPEDTGSNFYLIDTISAVTAVEPILEICARRIKVQVDTLGVTSDLDIYIVGRS